jgi:3-dehydroquinate synthase
MWQEIKSKKLHDQAFRKLINHSVEFKAKVTTEDPKERGLRKILNAGHTIGHALESFRMLKGNGILHGEAIAVGLIAEAYIAAKRGLLSENDLMEIVHFIVSVYGKIEIGKNELGEIAKLTLQDKKNQDKRIMCVLLDKIGNAKWDCEITLESVVEALSFYQTVQI